METAAGFLEYGILGLVIIVCFGVIMAMWKHLHKERDAHAARMKDVQVANQTAIKEAQTHYARERDGMREKFDGRLEAITANVEKHSTETLHKVIELTRDVTKTIESVKSVVEDNTRTIERWSVKLDSVGEKVLVLGERVEKLEGKN